MNMKKLGLQTISGRPMCDFIVGYAAKAAVGRTDGAVYWTLITE